MGVLTEMSEAEVLNSMMRSHDSMMAVLKSRHRSLQIIYSLWHNKDLKVNYFSRTIQPNTFLLSIKKTSLKIAYKLFD